MDDLIAFLSARLDEDEAAARLAASVAGTEWRYSLDWAHSYVRSEAGSPLADTLRNYDEEIAPFIARHDPARALREVQAKRRILVFLGSIPQPEVSEPVLGWLAEAYSGHPDYRQEWAGCQTDAPGHHGAGELADYDPGTGRSSWDDWDD